jgi:hypothetical protein
MLRRRTTNNGYWCGCHKETYENCEWVDDITPEEFLKEVYLQMDQKDDTFEGISYECEDGVVFKCEVSGGKYWEKWHIVNLSEEKLLIYSWYKKVVNGKQQELFQEKLPTMEEALVWLSRY